MSYHGRLLGPRSQRECLDARPAAPGRADTGTGTGTGTSAAIRLVILAVHPRSYPSDGTPCGPALALAR